MDRRMFLRTLGAAGAAGLLAGCAGTTSRSAPATPTASASTNLSLDDLVGRIAPGAEQDLSVITGSFEQLVGPGRPFAFGLTAADNEPLSEAEVDLHVLPNGGQLTGPIATEFRTVPDNPLGLYLARVDLTQPGATAFIVRTTDGTHAGVAALEVRSPEQSPLPVPGQPAPSVATPTVAAPGDVERLCTREPQCGMHEVSLDAALTAGRPVLVEFATPAYCQTTVCGPSVDVLDQMRAARDWGDTAFLHVEIYTDAGQTLAPPVQAWRLPSEPWLFAIARDGTITGRADGPLLNLADEVSALAEQVQ